MFKLLELIMVKSKDKSLENIVFQMISQTLNILIPVISIPIIINGLTLEKYGELAIYQSIFLTGIAVIEYGFNLSGSRIISSSNSETIKKKIINIFLARFVIFMMFMLVVVVYSKITIGLDVNVVVLVFSLFFLTLNVNYYMQYNQDGLSIFKFEMVTKLIGFAILIIASASEFLSITIVLLSQCLVLSVDNLLKFLYVCKSLNIEWDIFKYIDKNQINKLIRGGGSLFIGKLATIGYSHSALIYMGFFFSKEVIGVFALCDKIIRTLQTFFWPIIFNYHSIILKKNNKAAGRESFVTMGMAILGCVIFIITVPVLIKYFDVNNVAEFTTLVRYYSIFIVIVTGGSVLSFYYIIPRGSDKYITYSSWCGLFVFLFFVFVFKESNNPIYLCLSVLFSELISLVIKSMYFMKVIK